MATVTFSIASTPLTASKQFTGTDQDMQRILDWAKVQFATVIGSSNPTNGQAAVALVNNTFQSWQDASRKNEYDESKNAVAPPSSMSWST